MPAPDILAADATIDADFWAHAAQAAIRAWCGWHVAPSVTETLTVDGTGTRTLHLPTGHMTELGQVTVDGTLVTDRIRWSSDGMLQLDPGRHWPDTLGSIAVEITHGYDPADVPEVATLIAQIARRAAQSNGAITSQSVNGASVTFGTASGAPISVPLLAIEREQLRPYRIDWWPR